MTSTRHHVLRATFGGIAVLGALTACTAQSAQSTPTTATTSTAAAPTGATSAADPGTDTAAAGTATSDATTNGAASGSSYTDGNYSAEGSYVSPGGQQKIKVELTLADDTVTAVTVSPEGSDSTSLQYESQFASGISAEVVGKNIDELSVSKVSGSSLTSTGFNEAIEAIKSEAKA